MGERVFRVIGESVRPNVERDLLAGFCFPSGIDLITPGEALLKGTDMFTDITVGEREELMYVSSWGEIYLGEPRKGLSVRAHGIGTVATLTAHTTQRVSFTNEAQYGELMHDSRTRILEVSSKVENELARHLRERGRSRKRAQQTASNRVSFCLNGARSGAFLLDAQGEPRPLHWGFDYIVKDRVVDLVIEGCDDDYAPSIRNIRDVLKMTRIELHFIPCE